MGWQDTFEAPYPANCALASKLQQSVTLGGYWEKVHWGNRKNERPRFEDGLTSASSGISSSTTRSLQGGRMPLVLDCRE